MNYFVKKKKFCFFPYIASLSNTIIQFWPKVKIQCLFFALGGSIFWFTSTEVADSVSVQAGGLYGLHGYTSKTSTQDGTQIL